VETASLPELKLAERVGFRPDRVVFDSPAKTTAEIEYAIASGVMINIDSFEEMDRVAAILGTGAAGQDIGVRINPQVGIGSIETTSVAGEYSKFGIALSSNRDALLQSYLEYPWLTAVHAHVGSQSCPIEMLLDSAEALVDFADQANGTMAQQGRQGRVRIIDIGGGLPVSYRRDVAPTSMREYRDALQSRCPGLFDGSYRLVTEFGRYIHANCAWVATKVEYVKREAELRTAMVHVGADLFLRRCYWPEDWHHDIFACDPNGHRKTEPDTLPCQLAGPLCFSGDFLARDLELPEIEPGDYLVIHDAGAYTMSMWSRYNSRQMPKVIGYRGCGESFQLLKKRESLDEAIALWF
jgi:diaminopimelate decarboxylase